MFRYRSQVVLFALGVAAILLDPALSQPTHAFSARAPAVTVERTLTGIDVYEAMDSEPFAGKRVGLITNQTGEDSQGRRTIDVLAGRKDLTLVAIFSPEHGIAGNADAAVANSADAATGVPIYSLYGETRRPTDTMLKGIDVLIFDIQDAGVRFYTYITTMAYCMEAAASHHIPFVVFDRPDPLGGNAIEGPMLDRDRTSFTGYFPLPVRYGMTMGELARMFNAEDKIGAELQVFAMKNWRRGETYDQTGLTWIPPSPNLRTLNAAFLYPGIEILQAGGISVGRGTDTPFELVGAPWIRSDKFTSALTGRKIPAVRFAAAQFTPHEGLYTGQLCQGVAIRVTSSRALQSTRMGIEIAGVLHRMYPEKFHLEKIIELLGSQSTLDRITRGDPPVDIVAGWSADLEKFRAMRAKYLLYH